MRYSILDILEKYKDACTIRHILDCLGEKKLIAWYATGDDSEVSIDASCFNTIIEVPALNRKAMKFLLNPDFFLSSEYSIPTINIDRDYDISFLTIYFYKKDLIDVFEPSIFKSRSFIRPHNEDYGTCSVRVFSDNDSGQSSWIVETYKPQYAKLIKTLSLMYDRSVEETIHITDLYSSAGITGQDHVQHKDLLKNKKILKYIETGNKYLRFNSKKVLKKS